MQQAASRNTPSPNVVIPHFIFGGLTLFGATMLIILAPDAFTQHYFNPGLLSITHLLVLGWITMIIFGALYQLIPVIMEIKLFSERFAIASFVFLATGSVLLAVDFWNFWFGPFFHMAATFLLIAVILFAVNVFITAKRSAKKSIERNFILASVCWLLFTVAAGITLGVNLSDPFIPFSHLELLKLHANIGIAGCFFQLIIGVGSRLLPMFMVSHNLNTKKLQSAFYLINSGLILGMFALWFQWEPVIITCVLEVVSGIAVFLSFLVEAYKKRVKKHLDVGMKQSIMSFFFLLVSLILVLAIAGGFRVTNEITVPLSVAYGSTLLLGFITSLIMGQTYKTLPFIVWLNVYRNRVGKEKIPFPNELYSESLAHIQLWMFAAGFLTLLLGIFVGRNYLISAAGIILFCAVLLYNYNILKIIFHKPINK